MSADFNLKRNNFLVLNERPFFSEIIFSRKIPQCALFNLQEWPVNTETLNYLYQEKMAISDEMFVQSRNTLYALCIPGSLLYTPMLKLWFKTYDLQQETI